MSDFLFDFPVKSNGDRSHVAHSKKQGQSRGKKKRNLSNKQSLLLTIAWGPRRRRGGVQKKKKRVNRRTVKEEKIKRSIPIQLLMNKKKNP